MVVAVVEVNLEEDDDVNEEVICLTNLQRDLDYSIHNNPFYSTLRNLKFKSLTTFYLINDHT